MTILIDVDGVIFNTQETLLNCLNIKYDTNYTIDDITSYDWFDNTFDEPWKPMEYKLFWYYTKANKQAIDYILKWKNEGHTIKFVTASYYHHALPTKIHKLLDCFNGEFDDKDVIVCHDKSMVCGDLLIDDCADNCFGFNNPAVLYEQPWNRSCNDSTIVITNKWENIDKIVNKKDNYINWYNIICK